MTTIVTSFVIIFLHFISQYSNSLEIHVQNSFMIDHFIAQITKCEVLLAHHGLHSEDFQPISIRPLYLNNIPLRIPFNADYEMGRYQLKLRLTFIRNFACLYLVQLTIPPALSEILDIYTRTREELIFHFCSICATHFFRQSYKGALKSEPTSTSVYLIWIRGTFRNISETDNLPSFASQLANFKRFALIQISLSGRKSRMAFYVCYTCNHPNDGTVPIVQQIGLNKILDPAMFDNMVHNAPTSAVWMVHVPKLYVQFSGRLKRNFSEINVNLFSILLERMNNSEFYICQIDGLDPACSYTVPRFDFHLEIKLGSLESDNFASASYDWVSAFQDSWSFLSCFSQPRISFHLYVKPLQIPVWAGFFISAVVLIVASKLYFVKYTSFSPGLFIFAVIFNQHHVPSSISNRHICRLIYTIWTFVCITVTDHYLAVAISDLTAPLPSFSPTKFSHLTKLIANPNTDGISVFQKTYNYWRHDVEAMKTVRNDKYAVRNFDVDNDFSIYSYLGSTSLNPAFPQSYSAFIFIRNFIANTYFFLYMNPKAPRRNFSEKEIALINLHNPQHEAVPGKYYTDSAGGVESAVEDELTSCARCALMEKAVKCG
ncbi:hypothetical protein Fcan01_00116 [Folsomia candida]|uniref:Uncharacterized protein n=1 Tax=Folsomia candida TaxID=158441 RepID=A0A226F5B7_FOLCA|nr:hypothetical protein Fcan01_00116 [Folsomia candida]